jgi:hypothetical protein
MNAAERMPPEELGRSSVDASHRRQPSRVQRQVESVMNGRRCGLRNAILESPGF